MAGLGLLLRCLAAAALTMTLAGCRRAGFEVILLRHVDKNTQRGAYNLPPPAGFARANGLDRLIPACFGAPSAITTDGLDPVSSKNARSDQSVVPLAIATGLTIRIAVECQDHFSGSVARWATVPIAMMSAWCRCGYTSPHA